MRIIGGSDGNDGPDLELGRRTPVSAKDAALWLLERIVPGSGVNNIAVRARIDAGLDPATVAAAATVVQRRHRVLRAVFHAEGAGLSREVLSADRVSADVTTLAVSAELADVELETFAATPFDLDVAPPVRVAHLQTEHGDVVCVCAHHLVFDTISAAVWFEDFGAAYDALAAGRPVPDTLLRETRIVPDVEALPASVDFWRTHLTGFRADLLEPALGTQDVADPTLDGGYLEHELDPSTAAAVAAVAHELQAPEAVVYLAAYYLLLARHGAGPDLVVGTPVNTRGTQYAQAIGYHVNVLPLRVPVDLGAGFAELVARTRSVYFDALAHADVPVDLLLPELPRVESSWRSTIFRHLFNFQPAGGLGSFAIAGRRAVPESVENGSSKFDLEFVVRAGDAGTPAVVKGRYDTQVYPPADVRNLLQRYDALLAAVADDPRCPTGAVEFWSPADHLTVAAANDTADDTPTPAVLTTVAEHARNSPDAIAVEHGTRRVTYAALWGGALLVADTVRAAGAGPGDVVALAARRSPELAAAVFGVWLAGAAYLPIDPDHPAQRVEYQLGDAGVALVLAADDVSVPDVGSVPVVALPRVVDSSTVLALDVPVPDPSECAYLIYTSGSTGLPKGTRVSHGNLANLVAHFADELAVDPDDGGLWMTTFAFDMSVLDIFLPLHCGARLVVAPDEARLDGAALAAVLQEHRVDLMQATPTSWRLVLDEAGPHLAGMRIVCGGEPMPPALARRLLTAGCEVRNLYGPTETTVWSTGTVLRDPGATITVGRPIRNTTVFVVDADGRDLPVGVHGELCIAGAGVALGYHDRPELTAARFGDHPVHGRHYRTGDQARWRADGSLELVGRVDRQVKIRGNRVELGEVESVLLEHDEVRGAAVVLVGDPSSDAVLVAFVETVAGADTDGLVDRLWAHARERLPRAAVPHDVVVVTALPTTTTEKVDHPALTRLAEARRADLPVVEAMPHDDPVMALLLRLWTELLNVPGLGPDANFFVHGGHSLLGAQLVQKLEEQTGARLGLAEVFSLPTPLELAARLHELGVTATAPS